MLGLGFLVRKGCERVVDRLGLNETDKRVGYKIARGVGIVASVAMLDIVSLGFDVVDIASSLADSGFADAMDGGSGAIGTGATSSDLYYQDVTGTGYASAADYNAGASKLDQAGNGLWYPRQYQ